MAVIYPYSLISVIMYLYLFDAWTKILHFFFFCFLGEKPRKIAFEIIGPLVEFEEYFSLLNTVPMMDSYKKQPISPVIFAKLNLFKVSFMFVNFDVTDQKNGI